MIRSRGTVLGIDAGARRLKAAWLHPGSPSDQPDGWLCVERGSDDDAQAFQRLARALHRQGVGRVPCGLVIPNDILQTAVVEVPTKNSDAPRAQIAMAEFHRQLGMATGVCDTNISELPRPARKDAGDTVLVSGIRKDVSEAMCTAAVEAGLDLVYVGTPGRAMVAALGTRAASRGVVPILDLGWVSARLVLCHQEQVILRRAIPELGIEALLRTVAEGRSIELDAIEAAVADPRPEEQVRIGAVIAPMLGRWASRLVEEVRIGLSYAHHRYPSDVTGACYCMGGGVRIPGALEAIRSAASFEVSASPTSSESSILAQAAGAIGVALLLSNGSAIPMEGAA